MSLSVLTEAIEWINLIEREKMKTKIAVLLCVCVIGWGVGHILFTDDKDAANKASFSFGWDANDNVSTWYLSVGKGPNDFTWFAKDCNIPVHIIDCNGREYFVTPKPFKENTE